MSLSQLVGGADCGPVNPLQGLTKTWDRDRSLVQDQSSARAGSSRQAFHTSIRNPQLEDEAARFFSPGPSTPLPAERQVSFDLSGLGRALPAHPPQAQAHAVPAWARDFMTRPQSQGSGLQQGRTQDWANDFRSVGMGGVQQQQQHQGLREMWQPGQGMGMFDAGGYMPQLPQAPPYANWVTLPQRPLSSPPSTVAPQPSSAIQEPVLSTEHLVDPVIEAADLAATASLLLDSVKTETDPKFRNSEFMGLMQRLRDRTAVVEGNDIVAASQREVSFSVDERKGKSRADGVLDPDMDEWAEWLEHGNEGVRQRRMNGQWDEGGYELGAGGAATTTTPVVPLAEDMHEFHPPTATRRKSVHFEPESSYAAQTREWEQLLEDWDTFEGAQEEIRPVMEETYKFDNDNPYMEQNTTRNHALHSFNHSFLSPSDTVLEKEAAVQHDPSSATAWYELGVKQQENEREHKAIQALRKAVSLDPSYLDAWLALAVSLVNENDRRAAYDAVETWIERNARYHAIEKPTSTVASNTMSMSERLQVLMDQLLTMARSVPEGQIDADVQVALGVLFNTNEDYAKAIDCFQAALHVRQEDWQLYNRIGASLANSGNAADAMAYYQRALDLNPGYIRARYNMGISATSLKKYSEAAQHILDALVLQESESKETSDGRKGVTSQALWDGLRTASAKMRRPDLVTLCDQQDLDAYRIFFAPAPPPQVEEMLSA